MDGAGALVGGELAKGSESMSGRFKSHLWEGVPFDPSRCLLLMPPLLGGGAVGEGEEELEHAASNRILLVRQLAARRTS